MKEQFPIFHTHPELVYLDSASTSQKLKQVIEREQKFYEEENANVHRGLYSLSATATKKYEQVRQQVSDFIGAKSADEIAFTKGTTESINIVANSFRSILKEGDNVVVTQMEHHANFVPWQQVCHQAKAEFRVASITQTGDLDLSVLDSLLDNRTKILAVTHISNVLGTINPIDEIIKLAHKKNIPVLVDAAQSAGHLPLNVEEIDADFVVFSAHKMYGPMGVGVLYAKSKHHQMIEPLNFGGGIVKNVSKERTEFLEFPRSVEAGTPNAAGVISFGATLEFLLCVDLPTSFKQTQKLANQFRNELEAFKHGKISVLGNPKNAGPIVSFTIDGVHPHDVASILAEHNVAVRAGHHCAQPLHDALNVPATVRASFSIYNTESDIYSAFIGLQHVAAKGRGERLNQLYHKVILEQSSNPYHFQKIENSPFKVLSNSPVCGDKFEIYMDVDGDMITSVHFHGIGCAVSKASASVLAKSLEGKTIHAALKLSEIFLMILDKNRNLMAKAPEELMAFLAVRQFPERHECAALPWLETQKILIGLSK